MMTVSWGEELWDQYDNIAQHTYKGLDFLDRLGSFVKDRTSVELEYATKLRRLVKTYQIKKKEEDELQFSTCKAFKEMLQEVGYMAGQHEVIAENLTGYVVREVQNLVRELKDERKKALQEGARLQNLLNNQLAVLERSKKTYEKAWREAEKAHDAYQKADADLNLSRAEVQKQQMLDVQKSNICEAAKNTYASDLQNTNDLQRRHYNELMPEIFSQLRAVDLKRIQGYQSFMRKYVDIEREVEPIVSKCLDSILVAADSIEEDEDCRMVIEKFKSGFPIPTDIPFEDLSSMRSGDSSNNLNGGGGSGEDISGSKPSLAPSTSNGGESPGIINGMGGGKSTKGGLTLKGTLSASRLKKRGGIFGIFASHKEDWSDLPPNQKRKKIQQKLEELAAKVQQETGARDALLKMKDVYTSNPALGDPASIEGQLSESGVKLDRLRKELAQYQVLLDDCNASLSTMGGTPTPTPGTGGGRRSGGKSAMSPSSVAPGRASSASNRLAANSPDNRGGSAASSDRHSLSDDEGGSMSRSASDSSVSNPAHPNAPLQKVHHRRPVGPPGQISQPSSNGSSNSPESGLGTSRVSLPDSESGVGSGSAGGASASNDPHLAEDETDYFFDEGEQLQVLGTCRALYTFDAQSEGSIPMIEGEDLQVIELDQGDGWTRIRRNDQSEEGFVPTSYIEISLRGNC